MAGALDAFSGRNSAAGVTGRSSDEDVAGVRVDNSRSIASMPPADTRIDVIQTAQAQVNEGDALTSSFAGVGSGMFNFEIQVNGRTHNFNISVSDTDDNNDIQNRMANAINARSIGVRAAVSTGTEDGAGTTTLTLTGSQTGTGGVFSVTDVTGNLASAMGVTAATQDARNAEFTLNGGEVRTSQTNEVNIAAGVNITLAGEGRADISFGRSTGQAVSAAQDLVSAINSAIRGTNPNDGRGSARFLNDLIGMNITFSASLSRVGIDVQNNGQLSVDSARLQAAAEDGSLQSFFEGGGFAARAGRIASNTQARHYTNAPPPVNLGNNNFNFGNASDPWVMMNLFG
jgi:flagellar capping protein FliD